MKPSSMKGRKKIRKEVTNVGKQSNALLSIYFKSQKQKRGSGAELFAEITSEKFPTIEDIKSSVRTVMNHKQNN